MEQRNETKGSGRDLLPGGGTSAAKAQSNRFEKDLPQKHNGGRDGNLATNCGEDYPSSSREENFGEPENFASLISSEMNACMSKKRF